MSAQHRVEQAARRAKELARMNDAQLADAYVLTLKEPSNLNYSPYLITAIREAGLWDRLVLALHARPAKP